MELFRPQLSQTNDGNAIDDDVVQRKMDLDAERRLRWLTSGLDAYDSSGAQHVTNDVDKLVVTVDVRHFKPEDITVKIVGNEVIINGEHEKKMIENGWVSRQFTRGYVLPDDCDPNQVQSWFASKGVLCVEVAKKVQIINGNERVIPIKVLKSWQLN